MRRPIAISAFLLGSLIVSLATAVPPPPVYFTWLEPALPAPDATDVARDAAILLYTQGWPEDVAQWIRPDATVSVVDSEGTEIELGGIEMRTTGFVNLYAAEPLAPNERYTVIAELNEQYPRPEEATGETSLAFSFTTGDGLLPPLAFSGPVSARMVSGEQPVRVCSDAGTCEQVGTRAALIAHVVLPEVSGGFDAVPYDGFVIMTDGAPAQFSGYGGLNAEGWAATHVNASSSVSYSTGEAPEIDLVMPDYSEPYVPCFSLNLWDAAGHRSVAEPVCLDAIDTTTLPGADAGGGPQDAGADTGNNPVDAGPDVVDVAQDASGDASDADKPRKDGGSDAGSLDPGELRPDASADTVGAAGAGGGRQTDGGAHMNDGQAGAAVSGSTGQERRASGGAQDDTGTGNATDDETSEAVGNDDGGCSCRHAGRPPASGWLAVGLLLVGTARFAGRGRARGARRAPYRAPAASHRAGHERDIGDEV